ncbi:DoxX family protein (plasmid) [Ketogulonicigenium robustum]|uniref:DoxX family protein n=1 Tax=Ketogulonicigenium robustum TaxID=92947 RepID=A0A1W6P349_9RHOB|nr:DoxX family protein [Ketogulonicigenium robustum]ARO15859.1 DoxX family protein [Ketogulonicigenium robustum]
MVDLSSAPWGILLLRLALAALFFAHAGLKLFVFKPAGTVGFFQSLGLPGWFAYVTIAAEIIGAFALLLGIWPRVFAILLIPLLAGTIVKVHGPAGFWFNNPNGGWEYPAFWIVALLTLALLGDGAWVMLPSPF